MEIDTSACKTVMHKLVYNRKFSNVQLNDPHFKLTSVYGENLSILGTFNCTVVRNDIKRKLPVVVVDSPNEFKSLMGRYWIDGNSMEECFNQLCKVLGRKTEYNAVLFEYGQKSILNLVSSEGLKPVKEKIKAILDAPSPTSVTPLKSYLGLLNYGKFLPRLCEEYDLLKVDTPFKWSKYCQNAFEKNTASKWLDVHIMSGTNALQTVETLCKTFAIVGFPFELRNGLETQRNEDMLDMGGTGEMKYPGRTKTSTEPRQLEVSVLTTSRD
ncbi:hypothetical protein HUJ04_011112 [Dendroctonus ponderosae]|nr:hypothetical protein HUJ04_011112 [Dendroctonus ponderosae]